MKGSNKILYQKNNIPARLTMLFLVFNTWQTILTLNSVDITAAGIRTMEIILLNILLSFLVFIVSFEVKHYSLPWSWAGIGLGVFQILRIFMIPSAIADTVRLNITVSLLISGIVIFISSAISVGISRKYIIAKKESECPI